jgi:hypothetical protein
MSDYLTDLAAKARDLMPVVQPRLASLFEPPPGGSRPPVSHALGSDSAPDDQWSNATVALASLTDTHPRQQAGISSMPPPSSRVVAAAAHPNDAVETSAGRRQLPQPAPQVNGIELAADHIRQATGVFQPSSAPTAAYIDRSIDETALELRVLRQLGRDQGPESALRNSSQRGDEREIESVLEQPSSHQGAASHAIAEGLRTLPSHDREILAPQPTRPSPVVVKIVAQASAGSSMPTASKETEPTTTPAPAPTIRVSIGRIEVRAIMPPPSPAPRPKVARPSPGLSLEEFLKQRQRGPR